VREGNIALASALLTEMRTMKDNEKYEILSAHVTVSGLPVAWRLMVFYLVDCVLGNQLPSEQPKI
jgi:hypothetical protein